jgi:hypothetical protein
VVPPCYTARICWPGSGQPEAVGSHQLRQSSTALDLGTIVEKINRDLAHRQLGQPNHGPSHILFRAPRRSTTLDNARQNQVHSNTERGTTVDCRTALRKCRLILMVRRYLSFLLRCELMNNPKVLHGYVSSNERSSWRLSCVSLRARGHRIRPFLRLHSTEYLLVTLCMLVKTRMPTKLRFAAQCSY